MYPGAQIIPAALTSNQSHDPATVRTFLCQAAEAFQYEIVSSLQAFSFEPLHDIAFERSTLRAFVQRQYKSFADEMYDEAALWLLDDIQQNPQAVTDPTELNSILAGQLPGTQKVCGVAMSDVLWQQMNAHKGKELETMLSPYWTIRLFRCLSQRWPSICRKHTEIIYREVLNKVKAAVQKVAGNEIGAKMLARFLLPEMKERKRLLDERLVELFKPFRSDKLHALSRCYAPRAREICKVSVVSQQEQCFNIMRSAQAFYELSMEILMQNVADLGIESCILVDLHEMLQPSLFYNMEVNELAAYADIQERPQAIAGSLCTTKMQHQAAAPAGSDSPHGIDLSSTESSGQITVVPNADVSIAITCATPPVTPKPTTPTRTPSLAERTLAMLTGHMRSPSSASTSPSGCASQWSSPAHSRASSGTSLESSPTMSLHRSKSHDDIGSIRTPPGSFDGDQD